MRQPLTRFFEHATQAAIRWQRRRRAGRRDNRDRGTHATWRGSEELRNPGLKACTHDVKVLAAARAPGPRPPDKLDSDSDALNGTSVRDQCPGPSPPTGRAA